jgi:hypothetical protein
MASESTNPQDNAAVNATSNDNTTEGVDQETPDTAKVDDKTSKKENAEAAKARKAADSITDFHIEKEIDLKKAAAAVAALGASETSKKNNANLFMGEINAADVTTLVEECDMSKEQAEKFLRQNEGSISKALVAYLRQ